jgi:hypothetical protein
MAFYDDGNEKDTNQFQPNVGEMCVTTQLSLIEDKRKVTLWFIIHNVCVACSSALSSEREFLSCI